MNERRFRIVTITNVSISDSTLLRAVGLNAVLAMAGAPVRAQALRMSRLSACASIAVVDSLLSGKGDPMDFDYLLKPGVTRETNALAIARMAGVPV